MTRNEILVKATEIFRDVFDDKDIVISDSTTANDIEDWDSLSHITLVCELEDYFNIKFSMKDMSGMKNVGAILDILVNHKEG